MVSKIIPAILAKTEKEFEQKISQTIKFATRAQIDIMDGRFVSYVSVCPENLIKKYAQKVFLEAHLMIEKPEEKFDYYQSLDFKKLIPHYKSLKNANNFLAHHTGISIALNPDEPVSPLRPYLENIETVLLMGVNPGKMGQKFIPETLNKVRQLRKLSDKIEIEVDGGINKSNIAEVAKAGANTIVVGSAIFGKGNSKKIIKF
ncbi:MAG: ribulose-phosphate 3-epimerase [Candidatus Berkelbacteria bacterium Licking1014_7]|uniref:Ribulose-phosphate 3-epimerase n=1 Tax=Candidatus Berkelbacteria bacterium Licking1014_7 TaxID=2017147 RepID=A0A554LII1_9BACT|nr:MAG: ribulose-phosphate 3-epimerase [Candidatus Berkelbacteria bacterium Licking1014_7]